jgi:hypothetical protein
LGSPKPLNLTIVELTPAFGHNPIIAKPVSVLPYPPPLTLPGTASVAAGPKDPWSRV